MPLIARAVIVVAVAVLLALQVVATALVADRSTRLTIAARLWPSHPALMINRTMIEIGAHAARGESLPQETLRRVGEIARKEPLAPEPFLIAGALAQVEQEQERAERLFTAARIRDPRSAAARYFLADRYLRTGRVAPALAEIAVLSRLYPEARAQFGPALAAFAQMPGSVPQLRRFFRSSPELEPLALLHLSERTRNANLILALWTRRDGGADAAPPQWQARLVGKLVEEGQFAKAHEIWRTVTGMPDSRGSIFNPGFAKIPAPPPFNWALGTTGGVVEPAPGDRLQVIYFGRNDAVLAEQLLLLAPGRYQLSTDISGPLGKGGEIAWTLTCVSRAEPILRLPVAAKGRLAGSFVVPPGCPAQRLQLFGAAGEFPQSQEFTVGKLQLVRGPGA
jgi:hypothetical protein